MKGYFCIAFYDDMPSPKRRARYLVQDASIDTLAQLHSLYSMSISGGPDGADAKQLSATSKRGCGRGFRGRMHLRGNSKCSFLGKMIYDIRIYTYIYIDFIGCMFM